MVPPSIMVSLGGNVLVDSLTSVCRQLFSHHLNLIEHGKRGNRAYGYLLIEEDLKAIEKLLGLDKLDKVEANKIKSKLVRMVEQSATKYQSGKAKSIIPTDIFKWKNKDKIKSF